MPRSRIFPRSDIAGVSASRIFRRRDWIASSITLKLVALAAILIALPILLYVQFERADRVTRDLVSGALMRQSRLIAEGLRPILDSPAELPGNLHGVLARFGGDGTELKLMLAPANSDSGFLYVAAQPPQSAKRLEAELSALNRNGIARRLAPSCAAQTASEVRNGLPGTPDERLTSIIPIPSRWGCWVLISSHTTSELLNTAVQGPYWKLPQVRLALLIYGVATLLGCFMALSMSRAMLRFRRVANNVRQGRLNEPSFSSQNHVPELAPVAADFDALVHELHRAASDIRRKAEDNAHAFKTPLATIRAALSPLRQGGERSSHAIELIDSSVGRMQSLIRDAQLLDHFAADAIDRPLSSVNLSDIVLDAVAEFREQAKPRGVEFLLGLDEHAGIFANRLAMDIVVENILSNAVSFSPDGGRIEVRLRAGAAEIELSVTDDGPGVLPADLPHIFDRYYSNRPAGQPVRGGEAMHHSGVGLWIVSRNVIAAGGRVSAANRPGHGLRVAILLPRDCGAALRA